MIDDRTLPPGQVDVALTGTLGAQTDHSPEERDATGEGDDQTGVANRRPAPVLEVVALVDDRTAAVDQGRVGTDLAQATVIHPANRNST